MQEKMRRSFKALLFSISVFIGLASPTALLAQVKIMAVGDSITEGVFGAESYRSPLVDELNLSGCDYEMVGSRTENETQTSFSSPHEGYSGHRVDFFLNSTAGNPGIESMMSAQNPDVLLIHLGSNDMRIAQTVASTVTELDQLVTRVWNSNADAEIFLANVIPWYGSSSQNNNVSADIDSLGTAIENWVNSENDSRLHLVDVRSGYSQGLMQQNDLIHPNASGDNHIADAFLSAISQTNVCPDTTPPETFITNPTNAGDTVTGTYTYRGTATDVGGIGFDRVRIAIQDDNYTNNSNQWFNFSTGLFGPYAESVATLSNESTTSVNWSFTATLPSGDYTVYALAVDNAGNQDYYNTGVWPTNRQYAVLADEDTPAAVIQTPASDNETIADGNYSFSGTAIDSGGSGFQQVQVALRNRTITQWYNFSNGTFSGVVGNGAVSATLANTSNTNTDWNISATLPAGAYTLAVRAIDNAGNTSNWLSRKFIVVTPDNQLPAISINNPSSNNQQLGAGLISLSGNATDSGGSGFQQVQVAIRNRTITRWYNFSNDSFTGSTGGAANAAAAATLSNPSSTTSTNWSISATLPAGAYTLVVRAIDNAGNESIWESRKFVVLSSDNQLPATSINNPSSNNQQLGAGLISLSGNATDSGGSGFQQVQVAIRNRTITRWYNFSNDSFTGITGGAANAAAAATLSNPSSTTSTNWSISATLPAGAYTLVVRAIDNAGNESNWESRKFVVLSSDNQPPATSINNPSSDNQQLGAGLNSFSGNATDSGGSGFQQVQVAIRNRTITRWYNFSNDSFTGITGGAANAAGAATLSNPSSTTSTSWNISATLPAGAYTLVVRTIDNAGNESSWQSRKFSVE